MLTPTPEFAARQRLLRALRDPNTLQCQRTLGTWSDPNAPVCFLGLAMRCMEQSGVDVRALIGAQPINSLDSIFIPFEHWLGITNSQLWCLVFLNDSNVPFPQLAHHLETLPYAQRPNLSPEHHSLPHDPSSITGVARALVYTMETAS